MQQFIAPKVLRVNGSPSPCECRGGSVCAYCVQANLVMWEKKEHPEERAAERALDVVKRMGGRRTALLTGLPFRTVSRWLKTGKMPEKFIEPVLSSSLV